MAKSSKTGDLNSMFGHLIQPISTSPKLTVERIPTGIYAVDKALDGGVPKGRLVEFAGEHATLKTTTALCAAKTVLETGGAVLYIDLEGGLSDDYLALVGIVKKPGLKFDLVSAESAETVLDLILKAVDDGRYDIIILDSVAALSPEAELNGEMGDALVGAVPRLLSKFCRKLMMEHKDSNTTVILINQFRETIGNMGYGPNKKTSGGKALPYYTSLRAEFTRIETIRKGDKEIGSKIQFKITKSRVCRPYTKVTFDNLFDSGIDFVGSVVDAAVDAGLIRKSGAWFYLDGESYQGGDKLRAHLKANSNLVEELKLKLNSEIDIVDSSVESMDDDE